MKVGLFFGSFNPIHIGHLILAQSILNKSEVDKVWFVISPQNPFKNKKSLLHEFDRIDLVRTAIKDTYDMEASDIEFSLPKPSYTVDTLAILKEKYSSYEFSLIMGEDNLSSLHKWKNFEYILENHDLLVYPRSGSEPQKLGEQKNIKIIDAPVLNISATYIRKAIQKGESIKYMVLEDVIELMESRGYYKK